MHIGLIVGIGPAATDYYYRSLLAELGERGADLDLAMVHADTRTLLRHQMAGSVAAQVAIYEKLVEQLRKAGAEVVAITSIAGHFCINAFKETSMLPVIDLLAEVRGAVSACGFRKVGVIGTRVVMETRFYGALKTAEVIPPSGAELAEVHEAYVAMASAGAVSEEQCETFFRVGRRLVDQHGVEAVMLGGTDLALVFDGRACGFPTLDCASIHVEAVARAALL